MADGDQRVEVLEDEMKVLKGEVSRTLVDLRALLMREESPLMAGGLRKRVEGSVDASVGITTQVTLPAAEPPPPTVVAINAPVAPDQASSALASLPGLGNIEMPAPPGAPGEAMMPSQGVYIPVPPTAAPIETAVLPNAPSAGDFSPPSAAPESATNPDSVGDEDGDEERDRQRKARIEEEEARAEEHRAQRARRREQEQIDEEAGRERRNRKRQQDSEEDQADQGRRERNSRREQEDEEERGRRERRIQRDQDEDEDRERRRQRNLEEYEDAEPVRPVAKPANEEDDHRLESRGVQSESDGDVDDWETSYDAEDVIGVLDQEGDYDDGPMDLADSGDDSDEGDYESDEWSDDHIPGARSDEDSDGDLDFDRPTRWEDEIGDGYAASYDNGYADDRDGELGYPTELGPQEDFDSHEYQEEPKINEKNGSRKARRPDEGRQAYEDSYYEDQNQEYGRGAQGPPRSQRNSRPPAGGRGSPKSRGPAPDDHGYAPNGGNGQWGQPPAGYEQWAAAQEWAPEPSPMDLNLVSSLVRWASLAKYRVGEKRLSDIIELYVESRGATAGLKEALTHIASIVDDQPPESGQSAQETLDLIAHLHGILTAALPVPELPKIHSQISFVAGNANGAGNGNSNGDW